MYNLLNIGNVGGGPGYDYVLARDQTTGLLLTPPFLLNPYNAPYHSLARRRDVTWTSPDYYPTAFPGPYGRSECHSGLLGAISSAPWYIGDAVGRVYTSWNAYSGTRERRSNASAYILLQVLDTSRWAGTLRLTKIQYICTIYQNIASGGDPMLSVRASSTGSIDTSLSSLYGDQAFSIPNAATHTYYTDILLDKYLVFCFFINNLTLPIEYSTYPSYIRSEFRGYLSQLTIG